MTETEWLHGSAPRAMLEFLQGRTSRRKLLLFAVACCRRVWPRIAESLLRRGVEVAEALVDGVDTSAERESLLREIDASGMPNSMGRAEVVAYDLLWDSGSQFDAVTIALRAMVNCALAPVEKIIPSPGEKQQDEVNGELHVHAGNLHEIFGNPFRPITVDPVWHAWNDGTVASLARTIYDERAYDRMPILADALEDAGCTEVALLEHLRSPGPHLRGCWALDLLLGKE
jgi:hypothetical protein